MAKFGKCLLVSRHKLLPAQEEDIKGICGEITQVPELPTEQKALVETIAPYEVVIGTLPVSLIAQIVQTKKTFIMFSMKSLGTFQSLEEAKSLEQKYPGRVAILPGKPGEPVRVTLYQGLALVQKVEIVTTPLTQYPE